MKSEDKTLTLELAFIAVFFSMGIASMINADNTRMHLDIFEWSNNKTALSEPILNDIEKKEKLIGDELFFGIVFIGGV